MFLAKILSCRYPGKFNVADMRQNTCACVILPPVWLVTRDLFSLATVYGQGQGQRPSNKSQMSTKYSTSILFMTLDFRLATTSGLWAALLMHVKVACCMCVCIDVCVHVTCTYIHHDACLPLFRANFGQESQDTKHMHMMCLQAMERKKKIPKRSGQLQYIDTARRQQEKWKSRVQGGSFFKKNQVRCDSEIPVFA
jgi:hypothetical protein